MAGFVQCAGADLRVGSAPWRVVGANCYYLMTHAADPSLRPNLASLLDAMAASGMTLLRTWAFNDGPGKWNALQTAPGVYDERVLVGLDWVVAQCQARGIRLLLALVNYWNDYGGLQQYVRWSRGLPDDASCPPADAFYEDARAQQMMSNHITTILKRINTFTGVAYAADPTIMGWELINEPRCDVNSGVDPAAMQRWLAQGLALIKSLAPNQLTTVGSEGFWGPTTPAQAQNHNPVQGHGCDWGGEGCLPNLDFVSIHMYPDHWLPATSSPQDVMTWTQEWLVSHARHARDVLSKPILLTEFASRPTVMAPHETSSSPAAACPAAYTAPAGPATPAPTAVQQPGNADGNTSPNKKAFRLLGDRLVPAFARLASVAKRRLAPAPAQQPHSSAGAGSAAMPREQYSAAVLDMCFGRPGGYSGALWWMVAAAGYADYDGFTVYPPTLQAQGGQSQSGGGTWQVLSERALQLASDSSQAV